MTAVGGVAVLLGIVTYAHLLPLLKPSLDGCLVPEESQQSFFRTHLLPLDFLLCFLTSFFASLRNDHVIDAIVACNLETFVGFLVVAAVESTRRSARAFVSWFPVVFQLSQISGMSVVVPLFWLSTWCFSSRAHIAALESTTVRVVGVSMFFVTMLIFALPFVPDNIFSEYMLVFNFVLPTLPPLIWIVISYIRRNNSGSDMGGSFAAQRVYIFFSILLALHWFFSVFQFYFTSTTNLVDNIHRLQDLATLTAGHVPAYVMTVEVVILFATLLLWAFYEDGLSGAVRIILMTPMIGPGCAFLIFSVGRESRLAVHPKPKQM